jgi:flavin-binding protein dodecin
MQGKAMSNHVYKTVELTGSSTLGSDDAIKNAIEKLAASVGRIQWFQVIETRGHVEQGKIAHWQVTLKVGNPLD